MILPPEHWEQQEKILANRETAPQGLALQHDVAQLLTDWENFGCPTRMGRNWTLRKIQIAINHSPHQSALEPEAIAHFEMKVQDKVAKGQTRMVLWDNIKGNHPCQLKVLPVVVIPNKSQAYRLILNLSFALCLKDGGVIELINDTMEKSAPRGAIDQLGYSLKWIIHAFAEANNDATSWQNGTSKTGSGNSAAVREKNGILLRVATGTGRTNKTSGT
jgi:hypothetical protein